jgi:PAS domain S-box-containing protein
MVYDILPEEIIENLPLTYYVINLNSLEILKTNNRSYSGENNKCYSFILGKELPCQLKNENCICRQLLEGKEKATYIIENNKDGVKGSYRASASLIGNDNALVFYENITDKVAVQKELKINNKRLERAENLASFGYWEYNIDDNYVFASKGAMRIYGIETERILLSEVRKIALPEYREELEKQMSNLITGKNSYNILFKIKRQNDETVRYIHSVAEYREDKRMVFGVISDITETSQAREALRESENSMKQLFDNMNSAFAFHKIVTDDNGVPCDYIFLDINPKFEELTGLKRDEVINKSVLELMPETEKFWIEIFGEVALTGNPVLFSDYSGSINKYFEVSAYSPQKNYFAVTFTDITSRVKSERALNDSLLDLKMAQQIAKIGNWKYDPENGLYSWSEQVCEILECESGREKHNYSHLEKYFQPKEFIELNKKIKNALSNNIAFDIRLKISLPNSRAKWIEVICQPGEITSKNEYFLRGTVQDITENKLAEEEINKSNRLLRTVIDNIPEAIYLKDVNFRKLIANREDAIRCGYDSPEQIIGTSDFDLYPPEIAQKYLDDDKKVIENGKTIINKEEILPRENGDRIILTSKIPFKNDKNEILGLVGIGHDITEKRLLIDNLIKAKMEAEESSRLKSFFLTNMSHEIRTPLNGILGFSSIICSGLAENNKLEFYGKIIEKSGRRLIKMVDDIIDISLLQSGQMKFDATEFNLNDLLYDIFNTVSNLYDDRKEIEFRLLNCNNAKCFVINDKNKVDLILKNLLDNAFKFTKSGKIKFGYFSSDEENITLFVQDTGIGIDEEKRNVVFEAFRQAEEGDSRTFEGSGVGLTVVSGIIEKLGGKIHFESEPGNGTIFYVTLKKAIEF